MPIWKRYVRFRVGGEPKGQPRHRSGVSYAGKPVPAYDPGTANEWKALIAIAARKYVPREPFTCPVAVSCYFELKRPASLYRKKDPPGSVPATKKPDRDNLDKAVLDTLTNIGMFQDDSQVIDGRITKMFHAKDGTPGAVIEIGIPAEEIKLLQKQARRKK